MAVYVDDMNIRTDVPDGTRVVRSRWSHLFADTETELRAFATKIGLRPAWMQHPGQPHAHFDVTARMRQRALAAGATPVAWRQAGEFFAQRAQSASAAAGRGQALRRAAHLYLGHGLLPVPAWGAQPGGACQCPRRAACARPGKHPRSVHTGPGARDYSWKPLTCHTPEQIDHRFADDGPYASGNLMLAIPPGILVVDQDDDDGGPQALTTLAAQYGDLPATLTHATPHGCHHLYRTPPGWTGRAWVGKDTRNPLPPGIDLRVPGQILMAAPSQVPAPGGLAAYHLPAGTTVAGLPAAYLTAWTPPQPQPAPPRRAAPVPPDRADAAAAYLHAKITGILADLAAREPGGRNTAIYTAALKTGSALGAARTTPGAQDAASGWDGQAAEDALMQAAEANGYIAQHGPAAARSAIRSGLRNGLRSPRPLPDFTATPARQAPPPRAARTHRGPDRHTREATQAQAGAAARHTDAVPETAAGSLAPGQQEPCGEPAADVVTAVLTAAGYTASSHHPSTGRGEGFQVRAQPDGSVLIGHHAAAEPVGGVPVPDRAGQMLGRYARTLTAAGHQITSPAAGGLTATPPRPGRQPAATVSPEHARRAAQAAVAADEAYRAGDFGRARQLIGHAAGLDPSRAGLWETCHREITAKQLFTQAGAARQDGDQDRAGVLLDQCRELDPRLEARWHRHLTGIRHGQIAHRESRPAAERAAGQDRDHDRPAQGPAGEHARGRGTGPRPPGTPAREPRPATTGPKTAGQPQPADHGDRPAQAAQPGPTAQRSWQPAAADGDRPQNPPRQPEQDTPQPGSQDTALPPQAAQPEREQEACG